MEETPRASDLQIQVEQVNLALRQLRQTQESLNGLETRLGEMTRDCAGILDRWAKNDERHATAVVELHSRLSEWNDIERRLLNESTTRIHQFERSLPARVAGHPAVPRRAAAPDRGADHACHRGLPDGGRPGTQGVRARGNAADHARAGPAARDGHVVARGPRGGGRTAAGRAAAGAHGSPGRSTTWCGSTTNCGPRGRTPAASRGVLALAQAVDSESVVASEHSPEAGRRLWRGSPPHRSGHVGFGWLRRRWPSSWVATASICKTSFGRDCERPPLGPTRPSEERKKRAPGPPGRLLRRSKPPMSAFRKRNRRRGLPR